VKKSDSGRNSTGSPRHEITPAENRIYGSRNQGTAIAANAGLPFRLAGIYGEGVFFALLPPIKGAGVGGPSPASS
jgi:hypothetical protein